MRKGLVAAGGVALCLLAAACGSVRADSASLARADKGGSAVRAAGHGLATEAGNRKLAGSAELIALSYPGRPDVDLWVRLNGCGGVSNGYIFAG
jgi:hypothetical protein